LLFNRLQNSLCAVVWRIVARISFTKEKKKKKNALSRRNDAMDRPSDFVS